LSGASLTSDFIKRSARAAGFDLAGISSVHEFPELARFPEWIAAGHAGEMKYLESRDQAGNLRRASLKSAFPWARSVIRRASSGVRVNSGAGWERLATS